MFDSSEITRLDQTIAQEQSALEKKLTDIWLPFFRVVISVLGKAKEIKYEGNPKPLQVLSDDNKVTFTYGGDRAAGSADAVDYWIAIYYKKQPIALISGYTENGYITTVSRIVPEKTKIDMSYKDLYYSIFAAAKEHLKAEKEKKLHAVDVSKAMLDMSFEESVKKLIREGFSDDEIAKKILDKTEIKKLIIAALQYFGVVNPEAAAQATEEFLDNLPDSLSDLNNHNVY